MSRAPARLESPWTLMAVAVALHVALAATSWWPAIHSGGDNAAYVSLAASLAQDGSYVEAWSPGAPVHAKYPPLYPATLAVAILLGAKTWTALKALSLAFTAIATALCFLWVRRLCGPRPAFVAAALLGASPAVLDYSQWILADPPFLALTMGCLWQLTPDRSAPKADPPVGRLALGLALAGAAYFTRSAGLPLVAAAAIWLALGKRWTALAVFGAAFAALALPWSALSGGDYVSEFWLIDPYNPDLGRAGALDLVARASTNLSAYAARFVPEAIVGATGAWGAALGLALCGLAAAGWARRLQDRPGVAEIFLPLYAGLILLWPEQWSGDRFALPLFPLILLYAGESLARAAARWRRSDAEAPARRLGPSAAWSIAVVAAVCLALQGATWRDSRGEARDCGLRVEHLGPLGCSLEGVRDFHAMAHWAGERLPDDAVVFARKPRLFHVFSGLPAVTFPFTADGTTLLAQADARGVGYVVRGNWGSSAARYVDPVLGAHPERFCVLGQRGAGQSAPPTTMFEIVAAAGDDFLEPCPDRYWIQPPSMESIASMEIPILNPRPR